MSDQAVAGRRSSPTSWPVQSETPVGLDVTQPVPSLYPEKFIPVDRSDIVERSLERLFERGQRELAAEVVRYMCALRQAESARMLDELVSLYDPFNPDDETVNLTEISPAEKRAQLESLKEKVVALVTSANFNAIDQAALKRIFEQESNIGFHAEVDLAEYDFHLLYYRGGGQRQGHDQDLENALAA